MNSSPNKWLVHGTRLLVLPYTWPLPPFVRLQQHHTLKQNNVSNDSLTKKHQNNTSTNTQQSPPFHHYPCHSPLPSIATKRIFPSQVLTFGDIGHVGFRRQEHSIACRHTLVQLSLRGHTGRPQSSATNIVFFEILFNPAKFDCVRLRSELFTSLYLVTCSFARRCSSWSHTSNNTTLHNRF